MPVDVDLVAYLTAVPVSDVLREGPAPELPKDVVAVWHYASIRSDDYTMGASLSAPGSELEMVQVMVRNTVKATAQSRAAALYALLDNLQNATLTGRVYFDIEAEGPPSCLGQDANELWRYTFDLRCRKHRG